MESKNRNNNNGGEGQQQLRRSARIRKLNELSKDRKPAGGEVQPEPEECSSNKKNRKEYRNDRDLEIVQLPQENEEREIADETEEQADLPKPMKLLGTSTMDLGTSRPLPLELNSEIFKCLKLPIQRKFIWGLGRGIYGMFGQKLLKKTKRVSNPHWNRWRRYNTAATVAADGLNVRTNTNGEPNVFAVQPFPISGPHCRVDEFPGTICYYYEIIVHIHIPIIHVGLSDGADPVDVKSWLGDYSNSYAISTAGFHESCCLAGESHDFELPTGAIIPRWKSNGSNVYGCGLVLDPEDKLWIFFTFNGQLLGRKIPISPTVNRLFPAVKMWVGMSLEANFGEDPAKPFEYDIKNCPGLGLDCIK